MKRILLSAVLLLSFVSLFAQNSLSVEVERVVSIDENFRVVFKADGKVSDFKWEPSDDFDLLWGPQPGSMSSTTIVNGKRSTQYTETFTYILQAKAEGKFVIPSATATIEGKEYTSNETSIEVVAAQKPSANQQSSSSQAPNNQQGSSLATVSSEDVFLRMSVDKSNVVKGEPIVATLKLYTRLDISNFEDIKFPVFNGFWSQEIYAPQNIEFQRESVDGTIYHSTVLRRYMLIPQQSGKLEIDPAEITTLLRVRTSSGGGRSIFDDFFDTHQTIRRKLRTSPITVNVSSLPSSAPATFSGAVGKYSMSVKLSKDELKAHEASSITVTLSGKGNVTLLEAPKVVLPPDFEAYDRKSSENIKPGTGGTEGSKSFEIPFIPRSHGEYKIDPIKYTYFDIDAKKYVTIQSDTIKVNVLKGDDLGASTFVPGDSRQSVKNLNQDIIFIKSDLSGLKEKGKFFVVSPLFYILFSLLIVIFVIAKWLISRNITRRADVVATKNRKANKVARARLKNAGDLLKRDLYTAFYEELHKALLGYISDKLTIPTSEISKDRIIDSLTERGVNGEVVNSFINIVDMCEYARYAPSAGNDAMGKHYQEAVEVISKLESSVKNIKTTGAKSLIMTLLFTLSLTAYGADIDSLQIKAVDSYTEQRYQEALEYYQSIESQNLVSSELYYNIGNCYYKTGENAKAILYYERAIKLDPQNVDAKNNLALAQQFTLDKIEELPQFILTKCFNSVKYLFSSDSWAIISLIMLVLLLLSLLGYLFFSSKGGRKASFAFAIIFAFFALSSYGLSQSQRADVVSEDSAIITLPVVSVKSSPGDGGTTLFVIHEGLKVQLLDSLGSWNQIEIADGRQGWVESKVFEII